MAKDLETKDFAPWRMLGAASSFAMMMALSQPAFAQDGPDPSAEDDPQEGTDAPVEEEDDTIVITGYLQSLENAQNIKRDSDTFVDAITAEDIGALPDRSVAESLQRVPGVNIGRFTSSNDPDRFSVEGSGVIIRGLPYVRSELNGRDIFSATGGRELSFNDVSAELLGRVEVFKNVTADMVDGGIAGTVNLVTRKPLDNGGFKIAGTIEATVGDLAQKWSPGVSLLASNTFDTNIGTFGLQIGFAQSELVSRTDASQITDPCYRADLNTGCIRALQPNDAGGFSGGPLFDADSFPPAGTLIIPKGAGIRTTTLERDRRAISGVAQYESTDGRLLVTAEYLRADSQLETDEFAVLALVNNDGEFPIPRSGTEFVFDNGVFQSGILSQSNAGGYASLYGGVRTETLRLDRASDAETEDFSLDVDFIATDRLTLNFEAQHITSDLSSDSVIGALNQFSDIRLDATGKTPIVEFLAPLTAPGDILTSGENTYYWFLIDSIERNEGELTSFRADAEYDISDDGFFRAARFGARWADRERTTRNTNFSTWGNLSAPWTGRAGCAPWGAGPGCFSGPGPFVPEWAGFTPGRLYTGLPDQDQAVGGGAFVDEFPSYSQTYDPFGDNFQRGNVPTPTPGPLYFYGGPDFLGEYLSGATRAQAQEINTFSQTPNPFFGVQDRQFTNSLTGETTVCDPFCPPEVSTVGETTKAAYARVDFGHDFDSGADILGNFGLRYVETTVDAGGLLGFPNPFFFDNGPAGNGDGTAQVSEITAACNDPSSFPPDQPLPGFCDLSAARLAAFASAYTGEVFDDSREVTYDHWLPSFNIRFDDGEGHVVRAAVSKGISRPDLASFAAGGAFGDNTGVLAQEGTLETGPLFLLSTGNPDLRPVESWNYDLSFEWYWADVGSLTVSAFLKDLDGIITTARELVDYTSPGGAGLTAEVVRPNDERSGTLKGVEIAYQQVYDFLPAPLDGLGVQATYTYVDAGDFTNVDLGARQNLFVASTPLEGVSEHTANATIFYEKGPLSARAAYNWRSDYLLTASDVIFPYSPIYQEATGQLDGSIFYGVTDNVKIGVQGVNLLDEVTVTSQLIDFDGTRITRSAFRNDRRFTFLARFDF